jgi:3-oxoacyl-[acyl-carrier protein] reductase
MNLHLTGKIAIVTGASRGIGLAIARSLAAEGAYLSLIARNRDALVEAQRSIAEATGHSPVVIVADLTDVTTPSRIVEETLAAYHRIDILINNAGLFSMMEFAEMSDEVWERTLETKLFSTMRLMREVLPLMERQGFGRIINITGAAGREPLPTILPVGATNIAVTNISKALASSYATKGVTINCVCPGPVDTTIWTPIFEKPNGRQEFEAGFPMKRLGRPEEVAHVVTFLASELSSYVTGAEIRVDGGATVSV